MQVFKVGGCVRDALLGMAPGDVDWVVVGATAQQMIDAGYTPVGRDFPVFLHPTTHDEYALARTERKSAPGYHGFVVHAEPTVTLEDDLSRRDLTINAMAQRDDGSLVDPFGGLNDLRACVLRHVSDAFAEDPVRVLRLARFAARWPHFTVADETMALARRMVEHGEVDALVSERVWQEMSRGLMEAHPRRMLEVLRDCGALKRVAPEIDRLFGVPQPAEHHPEVDTGEHLLLVLQAAARSHAPLAVRYACLVHDLGKGTTRTEELPRHIGHEQRSAKLAQQVAERWRVPSDCSELAHVVAQEHGNIHRSAVLDAAGIMRLLERCDALRRPDRFKLALWACECDARGRTGRDDAPYPQRERLTQALAAALAADAQAAAVQATARGLKGEAVGQAVRRVRVTAIAQGLGESTTPP
jgi:tRNA nucleotidyltransferase (CCA-adding enzyme)